MPADDDYGRRQISSQQHAPQSPSPSPLPSLCPAGCVPASDHHHHQQANARYASEKNLLGLDRQPPLVFGGDRPASCVFGADRSASGGFGPERGGSDRLPSGERYQGVSERFPLGERPQTSVSADRLSSKEQLHNSYQSERYSYERSACERYAERYQNLGSLDRYHAHAAPDRYPRDKERGGERYATAIEKYLPAEQENSAQGVCSTERYDRRRAASKPEMYKTRERPSSSAAAEQYDHRFQQYVHDRFSHHSQDRFPAIPCPERFATASAQQDFGLEPPSPAPASDRFFPPPPLLSPDDSPASDCFSNNAFPSPTEQAAPPERFAPPQPPPSLSPSPTDTYKRYRQGYAPPRHGDHRYKDRYRNYEPQAYHGGGGERYLPPTAHVPVERYVPQPQQEPYFAPCQNYGGYKQYPPPAAAVAAAAAGDPYMRRDLAFHYRLPLPYTQAQYQRARYPSHAARPKCCQYQEHAKKLSEGYQLSKASPGSSSSSSLASQKESGSSIARGQEKEYRCGGGLPPCAGNCPQQQARELACRRGGAACASPSVEYVGASGGRHVCATPPPPRGGGGADGGGGCAEGCCARRAQSAVTVTVWRGTPQPPLPIQNPQDLPQQQPQPQKQPAQRPPTPVAPPPDRPSPQDADDYPQEPPRTPGRQIVDRAVSLPPPPPTGDRGRPPPPARPLAYTQSERAGGRGRPPPPPLNRSFSKKEAIKNYIRKETANFFGVGEESDNNEQQLRWLDRRKRMACRTMGPLKDEHCTPTISRFSHRRTMSEAATAATAEGQLATGRPDVLPGGPGGDLPDSTGRGAAVSLRRKDSVARMTWDGLSYVVTTLSRHRPRPRSQQSQWSRSFAPDAVETPATSPEEQSFFERASAPASPPAPQAGDTVDRGRQPHRDRERVRYAEPPSGGWRREEHEEVVLRHGGGDRGSRKLSGWLDRVLDNSDRRQYGMGWVGKMFGQSIRKSVAQDAVVQEQLDDMEDHRPLFTYWVTTVQILVLLISVACYGFGPFGVDLQSRSGQVLVTSLSLQQVDYMEPANFWFGPRAGDLIHLGAKFAPCMRIDNKVKKEIDKIRAKERETACCIRNDDSGCVQSSHADCSKTISTWKKWTMGDAGPGGRISGSVCGLDPKFCDAPASVHPYEWPDDITKWPICRKTNTQFSKSQFSAQKSGGGAGGGGAGGGGPRDKLAEHMVCEIIGHPCCIGIHGQCRITTKEYCDFVRGAFHEEASLCSQVSCLNDVCGMIPFYFPDVPDQFYRLWTSLFLHAGVLQLIVTVLVQHFLMRDLEKLTGSLRIGIIYVGSGVAGNLASAIFVPYRADVGPAGSQFGLLACLIVEVLNAWPMLKRPNRALGKLLAVTFVLFLVGLLPWVDNYAHLFGFLFGFLLSYALLPFVSFGPYDKRKKVLLIWACLAAASLLFVCLVLLFYVIPVYDCKVCSYFNCLPITRNFCASQNIDFKKEEPVV